MRYHTDKYSEVSDFATLLQENQIPLKYSWYPTDIPSYEYELSQGALKDLPNHTTKNMVRSLQYLEYIDLQLKYLQVPPNIEILLWKNFILTSCSIIEAALFHILPDKKKYSEEKWGKSTVTQNVGEFKDGSKTVKISVVKQEKLKNPRKETANFESIIDTVSDRKLLKSVNYQTFSHILKYLKSLRNRIHLNAFIDTGKHDYHAIQIKDYALSRFAVYRILSDEVFNNGNQKIFPTLLETASKQLEILNSK